MTNSQRQFLIEMTADWHKVMVLWHVFWQTASPMLQPTGMMVQS